LESSLLTGFDMEGPISNKTMSQRLETGGYRENLANMCDVSHNGTLISLRRKFGCLQKQG
jgi:hypothetical protein